MKSMGAFVYLCLFIAFLFTSGCKTQRKNDTLPTLEHDRVVFHNGKKVRFDGDKVYLQTNLMQPDIDKPVTVIERAFALEDWKRIIIETKYGYYEDSGLVFRFYDYDGRLLKKTPEYFGSFRQLYMTKFNRLILVQKSSHYALTQGYFLDIDGNQVGTIEQRPDAYTAFLSKEGDLFLIQYSRLQNGISFWTIEVRDVEGKVLATSDFKTGGSYYVEVGERKIPISLPNP